MTAAPPPPGPRAPTSGRFRRWWPLLVLSLVCTAIEAALLGGDLGLWGPARLRQLAYDHGGFWPGLLSDWVPNYPGQAAAMFLTYAFLHGGPGHLAANMMTLWALGTGVIARVGAARFWLIYLASALGGALGYALLARTAQPMVGASGALFGLAGALLAWAGSDAARSREGFWLVARVALLLVAINLAMYWALDGQLAWQTHLGGALTGAGVALLAARRAGLAGA